MSPTIYGDLGVQVEIPDDGTISRTLLQDERLKVVIFGFAAGQELSEHTASVPAVVHFLEGEARVTLGAEAIEAGAGSWIHMPAGLAHSISAKTAVKMLLLLLKSQNAA